MDTSKIIHAPVGGGRYTVTAPIVKEDYGLQLQIEGVDLPSSYQVDFSNSEHGGTSTTMISTSNRVRIPTEFIKSGKDIFAFLYIVGSNYGRTVYKFRIPNKLRPDRTNEQPTPEQQSVIDQAIAALNDAVEQTAQDVEDADESAQSASESAEQAQESARTAGLYSDTAQTYANSAEISANSASASATASAQSASQSAQIKADVEDLADGAQGYAQASAQSATASANSASQASESATSASQSASTASQKATEASQSAENAQTYTTQARQAKAGAETAQTFAENARDDAETARDEAVTAKENAEQAKADAESARDEAQQAVASISGALDDKAPVITDTASGAVASFTDGADDLPLKSLVVNIDPVQGLNGYSYPWPAGGGKNKFNGTFLQGYWAYADGAWVKSPNWITTEKIPCKASTSYTVSADAKLTRWQGFVWYDSNGDFISTDNLNSNVNIGLTKTSPSNAAYLIFNIAGYPGSSDTIAPSDVTHFQLEEGSSSTAYAPYSNICPISGWTEVDVKQRGKNLLVKPFVFRPVPSTSSDCFFVKAGTYTFSFDGIGTATKWRFGISMFDAQGNALSGNDYKPNSNLNFVTSVNMWYFGADVTYKSFSFTLQTDCYIRIWFGSGNTTASMIATNAQLEVGSSATPYEPYTGRSITIQLGQTVYGGKLNVLTGKLTVYPYYASYNGETLTGRWISDRDVYAVGTTPTIGAQVVNIGAEGTEIQLEPHEIASLLGQNNIFADTGDTSAEYRADTKLYINRSTEPDADMIADSNIVSGQYFMVGNSLYKATANIANGGQIVVGMNCTRVSLAQALNEINA